MISEILVYLQLGFRHIIDIKGLDHILFVLALCSIYGLKDWKAVAVLITAFTVGHSITLLLATFNVLVFSSSFVELAIPFTILLTCISNFTHKFPRYSTQVASTSLFRYPLTLAFGLIHGMGFSTYLRSLLGGEQAIWSPLLSFNIGLECGQLLIVVVMLAISTVVCELLNVRKHDWNLILSGIIAGMALMLIQLQLI